MPALGFEVDDGHLDPAVAAAPPSDSVLGERHVGIRHHHPTPPRRVRVLHHGGVVEVLTAAPSLQHPHVPPIRTIVLQKNRVQG